MSTVKSTPCLTPVIELRAVSYVYEPAAAISHENVAVQGVPQVQALKDVTLTINRGEYVCVLGANGSGKSTLLSLMGALELPTAGMLKLLGANASKTDEMASVRGHIAMVFQHPDDQMVTSIVADDVAFGPENLGVPQPEIARRVDEALLAVGMSDYAEADPADLSGGQCQRVAIAGALAMHPDVLLLDEPSAMLDVAGRHAIQQIIAELNAQGTTIVHVTHFMDDALKAQRLIVMEHGHVALDGAPDEVFADPALIERLGLELPFSMRLSRALNKVDKRFTQLPITADVSELADALTCCLQNTAPTRIGKDEHDACALVSREDSALTNQGQCDDSIPSKSALSFNDVSFSYVLAGNAYRKPTLWRRVFGGYSKRHARELRRATYALEHVSFTVSQGCIGALVGSTGAGKSTTVELTCALKVPLSGSVTVSGIDTRDMERRHELRRHIGYVSQLPERQLFAETVFEDVAFGPRNLHLSDNEVRKRVVHALEVVGLNPTPDFLGRSPFALSGGQQRAVAIAGVIAMQPHILVFDEPMAGLDPVGRKRMRAFIVKLKQAGVTVLMVTHDMNDAAELADTIVVLKDGHVVAQGTPRDVFIPEQVFTQHQATMAPGLPSALLFARVLECNKIVLTPEPLTLSELVEEVRSYGAAR